MGGQVIDLRRVGSSPPARGARLVRREHHLVRRITPACAGSTWRPRLPRARRTDHPRLRGEHICSGVRWGIGHGSPPPAQGAPSQAAGQLSRVRITPACAGSTAGPGPPDHPVLDHPRLRGEHGPGGDPLMLADGSPPPARGARGPGGPGGGRRRITPACAGSTWGQCQRGQQTADHPRLHGEHTARSIFCDSDAGSPPPARGARRATLPLPDAVRITPACAGSTHPGPFPEWSGADHPRLRGEHFATCNPRSLMHGSPPTARGAPRTW